jgi:hypothetical protein
MWLDRTYDIYGTKTDALSQLLPREFDAFRRHVTQLRLSATPGARSHP